MLFYIVTFTLISAAIGLFTGMLLLTDYLLEKFNVAVAVLPWAALAAAGIALAHAFEK